MVLKTKATAKMRNVLPIIVATAFCSGCGTIVSDQPNENIYGGIRTDGHWIADGNVAAIVDAPFSVTADTLFFPFDLYCALNSPADLVKGWTRHVAYEGIASVDPPNLKKGESLHTSYNIDESVIVDYTAYARSVWPKGQGFFISEVDFYEDGTGQHAVRIELEVGLDEYVDYYLFYDKSNQRTKVMRGNPLHHYYKGGC